MMKRIDFKSSCVLVLLMCLFSCQENEKIDSIELLFAPSFTHHSQFIIDLEDEILVYCNYLKDLEYPSDYNKSSFEVKTFKIPKSDLKAFLYDLRKVNVDSLHYDTNTVLDGIRMKLVLTNSNDKYISPLLASPIRTEKGDDIYKMLDPFFNLVYSTVDNYDDHLYIEDVQKYFDYDLPIKKVSNNQLEYRVWGNVIGAGESGVQLVKFLEKLSNSEPILFDVRNGSIDNEACEIFKKYNKIKNLYFYGYNGEESLKEVENRIKNQFMTKYKHPEFYGEFDLKVKYNWKSHGVLNTYRTKEQALQSLNAK